MAGLNLARPAQMDHVLSVNLGRDSRDANAIEQRPGNAH
jgi:hypothetical protein